MIADLSLPFPNYVLAFINYQKQEPGTVLSEGKDKFNWNHQDVTKKTLQLLNTMRTRMKEDKEMEDLYNCMIYHGTGKMQGKEGGLVSGLLLVFWGRQGDWVLFAISNLCLIVVVVVFVVRKTYGNVDSKGGNNN